MATRRQRREAVERYLNDPSIDIYKRAIFKGETVFDRGQIAVMAVATTVFGAGTLAAHFQQSGTIAAIEQTAQALPPEINDLGERMHAAQNAEGTTAVQTDLHNAVRYVLSREPGDIRNLTLIFPASGNTVTLRAESGDTREKKVDASQLAAAYREKLETRAESYRDSRGETDRIGGILTAGLAFFGAWAMRNSRNRVQMALDHYNIK